MEKLKILSGLKGKAQHEPRKLYSPISLHSPQEKQKEYIGAVSRDT